MDSDYQDEYRCSSNEIATVLAPFTPTRFPTNSAPSPADPAPSLMLDTDFSKFSDLQYDEIPRNYQGAQSPGHFEAGFAENLNWSPENSENDQIFDDFQDQSNGTGIFDDSLLDFDNFGAKRTHFYSESAYNLQIDGVNGGFQSPIGLGNGYESMFDDSEAFITQQHEFPAPTTQFRADSDDPGPSSSSSPKNIYTFHKYLIVPSSDPNYHHPTDGIYNFNRSRCMPKARVNSNSNRLKKGEPVLRKWLVPRNEKKIHKLTSYPLHPSFSYPALISFAIRNSPSKSVTYPEIYCFILHHFPYYRYVADHWKNSARHSIFKSEIFVEESTIRRIGEGPVKVLSLRDDFDYDMVLKQTDWNYMRKLDSRGIEFFNRMMLGTLGHPRQLFYQAIGLSTPCFAGPENSALFYHLLAINRIPGHFHPLFREYWQHEPSTNEPMFVEPHVSFDQRRCIPLSDKNVLGTALEPSDEEPQMMTKAELTAFHDNVDAYFRLQKEGQQRGDATWMTPKLSEVEAHVINVDVPNKYCLPRNPQGLPRGSLSWTAVREESAAQDHIPLPSEAKVAAKPAKRPKIGGGKRSHSEELAEEIFPSSQDNERPFWEMGSSEPAVPVPVPEKRQRVMEIPTCSEDVTPQIDSILQVNSPKRTPFMFQYDSLDPSCISLF